MSTPLRIARAGFSLAELLVAIALFVTAFVVLLGTITSSAAATRQSEDRIAAQQLAERILEDERALDPASSLNFPSSPGSPHLIGTSSLAVSYMSNGSQFTQNFTYNVYDQTGFGASGQAVLVTVNVTWKADNVNRSVSQWTAIAP